MSTAIATATAAAMPIVVRNGMPGEAEADQRDEHRDAGEHDGGSGGADRARGGLLGVHPART